MKIRDFIGESNDDQYDHHYRSSGWNDRLGYSFRTQISKYRNRPMSHSY